MSTSSSSIERRLEAEEIRAVVSAFKDKEALELLKAIRDNVVKESTKEQQQKTNKEGDNKKLSEEQQEKEQENRAFVGFSKEDDVIGKDEAKKGTLERLENLGLILKGGYIPLNKDRINSYKLTDEGYAILSAVEEVKGGGGGSAGVGREQTQSRSQNDLKDQKKEQQIGAFKSEYRQNFKEQNASS